MTLFPTDVLDAQRDATRVPIRYFIGAPGASVEVTTQAVLDSVLRALIAPPTARQLRAELLETGDYAALRDALEAGRLERVFGETDLRRLRVDVQRELA